MASKQLDLLGKALEVSSKMSNEQPNNDFQYDTEFYPMEINEKIVGFYLGKSKAKKGKFEQDYISIEDKDGKKYNLFGFKALMSQINKMSLIKGKDVISVIYLGKKDFEDKSYHSFVVGKYSSQKECFISSKGTKLT